MKIYNDDDRLERKRRKARRGTRRGIKRFGANRGKMDIEKIEFRDKRGRLRRTIIFKR